jgi:hypothetical protein
MAISYARCVAGMGETRNVYRFFVEVSFKNLNPGCKKVTFLPAGVDNNNKNNNNDNKNNNTYSFF